MSHDHFAVTELTSRSGTCHKRKFPSGDALVFSPLEVLKEFARFKERQNMAANIPNNTYASVLQEDKDKLKIDTTICSIPHLLVRYDHRMHRRRLLIRLYIFVAFGTFIPLFFGALFSPHYIYKAVDDLSIPFIFDAGGIFASFVSFPYLFLLLITDQAVILNAISKLRNDGVINVLDKTQHQFSLYWNSVFRLVNIYGQLFGLLIAIAVAYLHLLAFVEIKSWQVDKGHVLRVGYMFLFYCTVFYYLLALYVIRMFAFSFFLDEIARRMKLKLWPMHPDGAGGLGRIGIIGLRNQYLLSVLAAHLIIATAVQISFFPQSVPTISKYGIYLAWGLYVILSPLVFYWPLRPFRRAMIKFKNKLIFIVANRMQVELDRIARNVQAGLPDEGDSDKLVMLQKIGAQISNFPSWPFNMETLRKFAIALVAPIFSALIPHMGQYLFNLIRAAMAVAPHP